MLNAADPSPAERWAVSAAKDDGLVSASAALLNMVCELLGVLWIRMWRWALCRTRSNVEEGSGGRSR